MIDHKKIYLKGEDKSDVVKEYKYIGNKFEVTFKNGKTFIYNAENVQIFESVLIKPNASNCFEYLKNIANEVGLQVTVSEKKTINILSDNYSKIGFIDPESLLGSFLSAHLSTSDKHKGEKYLDTIYPFGFNLSQTSAIDKALTSNLSIIEGPPGTGKTQTILNIIANIIIRGESVAVVSSNNSATKNVFEKLQKNNLEFIAAYLGNTSNKAEFINSQKSLPDLNAWKLTSSEKKLLSSSLKLKYQNIQSKLIQQERLSILKQNIAALKIEKEHFKNYSEKLGLSFEPNILLNISTSKKALEAWLMYEEYEVAQLEKGLLAFIKNFFKFFNRMGLLIRKLESKYSNDFLIAAIQSRFYELRTIELLAEISKITNKYELSSINANKKDYEELSLKIFRAFLAEHYDGGKREIYALEDIKDKSESFIKEYPLILSTTYSLRSSLANNIMYDYVIIDEASQVDLCTGALALSCAKKAVIVGDLNQLPHVVDTKTAKATDLIFAKSDLPEPYRYKNNSLLSSVIAIFPETPKTLLREHYRCHPKIIDFCNKKFYGGELIILTDYESECQPLVLYKTVEGNHERNRVNQRQIDVIKQEIIPEQSLNTMDGSLGIITPYRNQTNALQKAFAGTKIKADTVDKFQGQESSVVILSTVDNEISDFLDNANRLNVAVSRAVNQLIVVVNDTDSLRDKNIGDLVKYIEYNNLTIVESKIYSVFDYLYRNYRDKRIEFLAKKKRISDFDSENLMYVLILKAIRDKNNFHLEVTPHVPLKMIFKDTDLMTTAERQYAMNILTHVDFLIYDTISKAPKFAVEVDGVAFHTEGSRQSERDNMKNEIFRKYGISLLRFRTDGSGEVEELNRAIEH